MYACYRKIVINLFQKKYYAIHNIIKNIAINVMFFEKFNFAFGIVPRVFSFQYLYHFRSSLIERLYV